MYVFLPGRVLYVPLSLAASYRLRSPPVLPLSSLLEKPLPYGTSTTTVSSLGSGTLDYLLNSQSSATGRLLDKYWLVLIIEQQLVCESLRR